MAIPLILQQSSIVPANRSQEKSLLEQKNKRIQKKTNVLSTLIYVYVCNELVIRDS